MKAGITGKMTAIVLSIVLAMTGEIKSRDEAGQLFKSFGSMVGDLSALARGMMQTSAQLSDASRELTLTAAHTCEASRQISLAVDEVAAGAMRQSERAGSVIELVERAKREIVNGEAKARTAASVAGQSTEEAKRGESAMEKPSRILTPLWSLSNSPSVRFIRWADDLRRSAGS